MAKLHEKRGASCGNEPSGQFVIFKPLTYCFKETGFDVKASFASRP